MLSSLNILDFTSMLPGPKATQILADLDANVLKIENPTRQDPVNILPPRSETTNGVFRYLNRNKHRLPVDLKTEEGKKLIRELVPEFDIVIEGFRPGTMEKLGLDYDSLSAINDKLIYVSISGYGQDGPAKSKAGHDINYLALSGIASLIGSNSNSDSNKGTTPILPGVQLADIAGGAMYSVISLLAAVIHRNQTGQGQHIDVAMRDSIMVLGAIQYPRYLIGETTPTGNDHILTGNSYYGYYETKDGKYLSIGGIEEKFFATLCDLLDLDFTPSTRFMDPAIQPQLKKKFKTKSLDDWTNFFEDTDVCIEPVLNIKEVANHPLSSARGNFVEVPTASSSEKQVSHPVKYSEFSPEYEYKELTHNEIIDLLAQYGINKDITKNYLENEIIG